MNLIFLFLKLATIVLLILSGRSVKSYESVHNKSLGKMEMLEAIDNHIKNSISKDISFLKREVERLKSNKPINSKSQNTEIPRAIYDSIESNRQEISRLSRQIDSISAKVATLTRGLEKLTSELKTQNEKNY